MNENDLLQKLAVSKKIMERHNQTPRKSGQGYVPETPQLDNFKVPQANYNIPEDFMVEAKVPTKMPSSLPPEERIMASKLPNEIKRLMIEHPIQQPNNMGGSGSVLSNELIEKAARLMNNDVANNVNPYQPKKQVSESSRTQMSNPNFDKNTLKDIIRETIEEVLSENGLLIESTSKTNDVFQFRVGSHIFEGKVTRVKKVK